MKRYRSLTLAAWLSGGSVAIVVVAVAMVVAIAVGALRTMSERAALARADLAAASSLQYLNSTVEGLRRSARLLASRPSLRQLVRDDDRTGIHDLLQSYCNTAAMDACAVIDEERVVAAVGVSLPWTEWRQAAAIQGEQIVLAPKNGDRIVIGGMAQIPEGNGVHTVLVRLGDYRLLHSIGEQVGATVKIINRQSPSAPEDDFAPMHQQAEKTGKVVEARIDRRGIHAATVPLRDQSGAVVGFIDAEIPVVTADWHLRDLAMRFGAAAALIVGLTGLGGFLYGNWLIRPVRALRDAAVRFGQEDFTPTIEVSGTSEVAALARTMEDMRYNLMQATAALRRSEAETKAVLAGIMEGVYAVDSDRRISYANPQLAQMLNVRTDDIVGRFCGDVLKPLSLNNEVPCERNCPLLVSRSTKQQCSVAEQLWVVGHGTRSVVIVSAPPVDGRQVQVMRDETEREAANRARDSVLANISHEFRTPLAAQLASVEMLHEGLDSLSRPEQEQLIEYVRRSGSRLMRLIDNLLESVRIEAGQVAVRQHPVSLPDVIDEATAIMKPVLVQRHQELTVELPAELPVIIGDAQRLTQVFVNLLANASKFAPEGSTVGVSAEVVAGHIRACVADEGPGIANADQDAVFRQFSRGTGGEPESPGLGLGLWIVKSIVERHEGTIAVERVAGKTLFVLTLPAKAAS